MVDQKTKDLISFDNDYVHIKRVDFSLSKLIERYPDGVPDRVICQALQITEEELNVLFSEVLSKLKKALTNE